MRRGWATLVLCVANALGAGLSGCKGRALQEDAGSGGMLPGIDGGAGLGGAGGAGSADGPIVTDAVFEWDARIVDGGPVDALSRPDSVSFIAPVTEQNQCHDLANTAPYILPLGHAGDPSGTLRGGQIADGIYELYAADWYQGDGGTQSPGTLMRRTIQFSQNASLWLITDFIYQSSIAGQNIRPAATITFTSPNTFQAAIEGCYGASTNDYVFEATIDSITMWHERTRSWLTYARVPR